MKVGSHVGEHPLVILGKGFAELPPRLDVDNRRVEQPLRRPDVSRPPS
jgi:hypothetical protein